MLVNDEVQLRRHDAIGTATLGSTGKADENRDEGRETVERSETGELLAACLCSQPTCNAVDLIQTWKSISLLLFVLVGLLCCRYGRRFLALLVS